MQILALIGLLTMLLPSGQPVAWTFSTKPAPDGAVDVMIQARMDEGWHIYAMVLENDLGPIPTAIRFQPTPEYSLEGVLVEPEPEEVYDNNFMMQVRYHSGDVRFEQRVVLNTDKGTVIAGEVEFMACNDRTCLPPEVLNFALEVPGNIVKP